MSLRVTPKTDEFGGHEGSKFWLIPADKDIRFGHTLAVPRRSSHICALVRVDPDGENVVMWLGLDEISKFENHDG